MYQYRANVEFDIDGLKDFYIDDLMEQELNIYLMVECWIRDYIDINDMYIRMVEDGHEILEWESFLPSELSYRSLFVASNYKLGYKNQCIDLLIITHIDEDHIDGAIEFFKENGYSNKPNIIEVKEIWYNSYRHLQFEKGKIDAIERFERRQLRDIILSNLGENREGNNEFSNISARQGSTLAGYLYEYGYSIERWNTSFNNEAVNLDKFDKIILGDIKFYMLSPNSNKLKSLSKLWEKELMKIDKDFKISNEVIFDDAYEMYIKNSKQLVDIDEESNVSSTSKEFKEIISNTIRQDNKDISKSKLYPLSRTV